MKLPQWPEAHWPLAALLEYAPLRALGLPGLDDNTQAGKDTSEYNHETKRVYLSVLKSLKAPLSGLRPTGHSQPYLKLPLCGPRDSWLGWQYSGWEERQ